MVGVEKKRILLVEDQAIIALSERLNLEKCGYQVMTVASGEEAVRILVMDNVVDLVLMDINLGKGMAGTKAAEVILMEHDLPIIFLSSHTETEIIAEMERITAYGYVIKNSGIIVLDAAIKMALKLFYAHLNIKSMNEKLEATLDALPDLLLEAGLDGRCYDAHFSRTESAKATVSGFIGSNIEEFLSLIAVEAIMSTIREANEKGFCLGMQYQEVAGDRNSWRELSVARKADTSLDPRFIILVRDISKRKHSEDALADSEVRYRRLFETAQDGILILDSETGKIMDVNPYLMDMLGYSKEEFLDKAIWDIGTFQNIIANQENFLELQKNEYIRYDNMPLETADGEKVEVEFVSNVYLVGDHSVIQCNIRNIAKRKHKEAQLNLSEIRYRRLFETSGDGILMVDAESGKILDVNPFLISMLGFTKGELLEKALWDIGSSGDVHANKERFKELQKKEYVRYEDLPLETAKGEIMQVEIISNLYWVGSQKVIRCNVRDVSERKKSERKINELLAEKELILKEVHHRIKNNMETISSLLALQAETVESAQAVAALDDAGSRVRSMMLLYEKLYQSSGFDAVSASDYLSSLADEILANFSSVVHVEVRKEIEDFSLSPKTLQPLGMIVNELLTNIMKYAFVGRPRGSILISASLRSGRVRVAIEDDGVGMPAELDYDRSSGFGLMLVHILTQQLGGTIRIDRGEGTKVILEFES
jgi:PAS domain S-box-containing protein